MKRLMLSVLTGLAGFLVAGPTVANDEASIVRGGRLYDHWSRELKERPPHGLHPLFTARRNELSAADSWRCKECHGLDYAGKHGIVGIRGRQGAEPAAIVALLKDRTHRYGELLGESDLLDLANFVSRGQVDLPAAIEGTRRGKANPAAHEKYYGTICAACHGLDGGRLREIAPLGDVARRSPHEVLHVILNGHPGQTMPALRALGADFAARMLLYLQTLPSANLAVSIAHGGRLYDNWQAETGAPQQALAHPAYPPTAFHTGDAPLTWRCKSCHGWDYLGNRGSYASGRNATGIKGIRDMAGTEPGRIVAILRDATHKYDAVLKERDLQDLAFFVSQGQIDMDVAIDRPSGRARGDAERASAYYRTICATCHGSDGRRIITTVPLGRVARTNPWESLHKIANGHPNEKMPALRELDQQLLIDILAYLQGLPETR
jgi:mono/diheme cytochrome c family protein